MTNAIRDDSSAKLRHAMGERDAPFGHGSTLERLPKNEPLTFEKMRAAIAGILGQPAETIPEHASLIGLGLESVAIMSLITRWLNSGVRLVFGQLVDAPTLADWWRLAQASQHASATHVRPAPHAVSVDDAAPFELSLMQQAYWVGSRRDGPLGKVSAHFYVELDGSGVRAPQLESAVRLLLRRHGMLRARFLSDGRQCVLGESYWPGVKVHDLRLQSVAELGSALADIRAALALRRLQAEQGEVLDVQLSLLPSERTRVHLNLDMLVSDARSFQIALGDLAEILAGRAHALPAIEYTFQRYLAERARQKSATRDSAERYWKARLDALPGAPQLPLASGRLDSSAEQTPYRRSYWLARERRDAIARRAREAGLTLSCVFATAFAEVLAAWSAQPRFLLNLPLFDRQLLHPDVSLLVGDFSELLILAVDMTETHPFEEHAKQLQAQLSCDVSHSEYSGLEVLRELARARPGDWPVAPVVFTSVIGMGDLFSEEVRRRLGTPGWISSQTPEIWLDQQITDRDEGLLFNWDVVERVFAPSVVDAMFDAYVELIVLLAEGGAAWSRPIPSLLPRAQRALRDAVNETMRPLPAGSLHGAFFELAALDPQRQALACGDTDSEARTWSYGALARWALSIAGLLRARGIGPNDTVAVSMARGAEQVAAVLAVLAVGATYLPVGLAQPAARRAQIYRDMNAKLVLTRQADERSAQWSESPPRVAIEQAEPERALVAPATANPNAIAYVIATSGSTGAPKGIEMSHAAVLNTIADVNRRFSVTAEDRTLMISALDFDLSVYDIFGILSVGGSLVVPGDEHRSDPSRWLALLRRWKVSIWNSVPAIVDMLLTVAVKQPSALSSLRLALVSGDFIGVGLPERLRAVCPECRFVALGGATEAAIWSNAFDVQHDAPAHGWSATANDSGWRSMPYGFPLGNQKFRVVDQRGRDCPDWVTGELWIGGRGLALGYRNDPERSADRFVESAGERWYRTGDLGRYRPNGVLEFLGRSDYQIKIRGHRVELGEIEAALQAHPRVGRAVALVIGAERNRLAVAVVLEVPGVVQDGELRAFAATQLPPYMVPECVVVVERLPLTSNGKPDRSALQALLEAAPVPACATDADEPPQGATELEVEKVWRRCLGVAPIARRQNFFALGGDSLTATRLLESLRQRFGVDVSHREFLLAPTVTDIARAIEERSRDLEEGAL